MAALSLTDLLLMGFDKRMISLRKQRGLTQQALAEKAEMHVVQIRRYETNASQPSIEAIKKLATALGISTDALLFEEGERGPDDELRLQFEALKHFSPEEKQVAKAVLESLILKHDAQRFSRSA
ncbi:MAG: helix-turn-helix domain-containing protein [Arenimonas sp.]